jgi:hypothetical protein
MLPVDQRITKTPGYGDCMQAAVASLLELPYEKVPAFRKLQQETGYWHKHLFDFLEANGFEFNGTFYPRFQQFGVEYADKSWLELRQECPGVKGFYMASGPSPRKVKGGHAVIIDGYGKIVHDPHPSRLGVPEICDVFMIEAKPQSKGGFSGS